MWDGRWEVGGGRGAAGAEGELKYTLIGEQRQHTRKWSWYLSTKVVLDEDKLLLCPYLNGPWQTVTIAGGPPFTKRRDLISGVAYTLPGSTCSFIFLRRRNIYVSEMCLVRALGSWVFPVAAFWKLHHISHPLSCQRALLRARCQSPPCDACPYAGCISSEKLWRIAPTGMTICPLTDIAWALRAYEGRILKHLVHYITALWWMGFTRACHLSRTNYL